jgi:hypothetical protein
MKFQTLTSEYEITADSFGVMTLEKTALLPGCHSKVQAGQKFYARRGDAILFGLADNRQLLFGDMNTSHIPDNRELQEWLEKNK